MLGEEQRRNAEQREGGKGLRGRDTVNTMDEGASTTDALGSADYDGAPELFHHTVVIVVVYQFNVYCRCVS